MKELQPGQNPAGLAEGGQPALGAAPQAAERNAGGQAGLPFLGSGAPRQTGLTEVGAATSGEPERLKPPKFLDLMEGAISEIIKERGGNIEGLQEEGRLIPVEEAFSGKTTQELDELRARFPHGVLRGIEGGQDEMMANLAALFTQAEPVSISPLQAKSLGLVSSLMLRRWTAKEATEYIKDWPLELNAKEETVRRVNPLATVMQMATTGARPVYLPSAVPGANLDDRGNPRPVALSPLRFHQPWGEEVIFRPFLPADLEPEGWQAFKYITGLTPDDLKADNQSMQDITDNSRKAVAMWHLLLSQSPGLTRSMSTEDQLKLMQTADRFASGLHDEAAVLGLQKVLNEIQGAITSSSTEKLKGLYEQLGPALNAFEGLVTYRVPLEFDVLCADGRMRRAGGFVSMGDFLDDHLFSQENLEAVQQSDSKKVQAGEMAAVWRVLGDKLGYLDAGGNRVPLKEMLGDDFGKDNVNRRVLWTNIPDVETGMHLSHLTRGNPMNEMVASAIYGLYKAAKEWSRMFLMDMEALPVYSAKAGKKWREILGYNYAVHLYRLGMYGLADMLKVSKYRGLVSEKIIPKAIDKIHFSENRGPWLRDVRGFVEGQGGRWVEAWSRYKTFGELQRAVVERVFTRPTLLESETGQWETIITLLLAKSPNVTLEEKVDAIVGRSDKDSGSILAVTGGKLPTAEEQRYRREVRQLIRVYESQPLGFEEVKHKLLDAMYRYRGQRPGGFKPKEEVLASLKTLTAAERAVLNYGGGVDVADLAKKMGFKLDDGSEDGILDVGKWAVAAGVQPGDITEVGYRGVKLIAKAWGVSRMTELLRSMREIDLTSVAGYLEATVELRKKMMEVIEQIASGEIKQAARLPGKGGSLEKDISVAFNITSIQSEYMRETFHYVPLPHHQERAEELVKVMLKGITPLNNDEPIPVFWRVSPVGANQPTIQEAYIPMEAFIGGDGRDEGFRRWLLGMGIRGAKKGGKSGEIFFGDDPPRLQVNFGGKNSFADMREAAKRNKGQPASMIGMERSGYETVGWKTVLRLFRRHLLGNNLVPSDRFSDLEDYGGRHFRFGHGERSETAADYSWEGVELGSKGLEFLGNLISKLAGG